MVDLWGGWADEARTVPWGEDTITNVFSTTKTMTTLAALVLVDRGDLDLDATVARYWPEFAANGKAGIKAPPAPVAHLGRLPGWEQPITLEDMCDWEQVDRPAGRAGAWVGTRDGLRLPRGSTAT